MSRSESISLPILQRDANRTAGTKMARWRTVALILVHLLIAAHIIHYLATDNTLTPLEPSEAGYSIRNGAINAGAIFLCLLILSTLVFGRFFCGWACHVVAYQDAARWVLVKLGLRPKPIRARLLMLVPLFAVFWLYGRPLIARLTADEPEPGASLHLTTNEFWATFPGPVMTIITFAVCGFVVVYFLGSKGFCTYGCPYGALFGIADRAAPGRIRVNENCDHSGHCTKNCSSNVDVAREVALYGMVVDSRCLKCMDCVSGCPNDALYFGFKPTEGAKQKRAKAKKARKLTRRHYDFSWPEELFMAGAFVIAFAVFYNLYREVPFLLTLGLATVLAFLALIAVRLFIQRDLSMQQFQLRREGRLTSAGWLFAAFAVLLISFTAHSALIQWNTREAADGYDAALAARKTGDAEAQHLAADGAIANLTFLEDWGVFHTRDSGRMHAELLRWCGESAAALPYYQRELAHSTRDPNVSLFYGLALLDVGRFDEARAALHKSFESSHDIHDRFADADAEIAQMMQQRRPIEQLRELLATRIAMLRQALKRFPDDAAFAVRLCRLLIQSPDPAQRNPDEAFRIAQTAAAPASGPSRTPGVPGSGASDANLLGMLAWMHSQRGEPVEAVTAAERAVAAAEAQGQIDLARQLRDDLAAYRSLVAD